MMFSEIEAYGHFRYAGQRYLDKYQAFDWAIERLDWSPKVEFVMPTLDALGDTTIEPEQSIDEMYRARAQHLRDCFDYLILMYSGGIDSHQMLMTFLKHDIHVDEVQCRFPLRFINRLNTDGVQPDHPLALMYEYPLAALPGLQMVARLAPQTWINVVDTSDELEGVWTDHGLEGLFARTHSLNPCIYHTIKRTTEARDHQRTADAMSGRQVAVLVGADKPYMRLEGDMLCVFFPDTSRSGASSLVQFGALPLFTPVMFYWGDPRITIKQAHLIRRSFVTEPGALAYVSDHRCDGQPTLNIPALRSIYPDWHGGFRQRAKALNNDDRIMATFVAGKPLYEFTRERAAHFNANYGALSCVTPLDVNYPRRCASSLSTRSYPIGVLDVVGRRAAA